MRMYRMLRAVATGSAAAVLLLLAVPPLGASPPASSGSAGVRGSELVGRPVQLRDGRIGAWVSDVLVDWTSGDIRALLLELPSTGGAKKLVRLPVRAGLAFRDGHVVVDLDARALSGLSGSAADSGRERAPPSGPPQELSAVLRADLRDGEGRDIGDIEEVIVQLDQARVANLAVRFDPAWVEIEGLAGLPLSSVRREGDGFVALFDPDHVRPAARKPAPSEAASPPAIDPLARLSRVLSASVTDAEGRVIGHIHDALIDVDTRHVTGIVISLARPWGAMSRVTARFPQPALRFQSGKLSMGDDPQRLTAVDAADTVLRARRLLDMRIVDGAGEAVGEVEDAVVSLRTGRVRFAVAKFDTDWVRKGMLVAIPLRSTRAAAGGELAMVFGLNELNRAYLFESRRWPDLRNPDVRAAIEAHVSRL